MGLKKKKDLTDRVKIIQDDITRMKVDAIVNAANQSLLGGGGVDGSIHRSAGKGLLGECKKLGGCNPGEAKITKGYHLPAKWVIHTVGPIWRGGNFNEDVILANCYQSCLNLAEKYSIKTIAFPSISTGAYGFPIKLASSIAIITVRDYLNKKDLPERVIFVCFSDFDRTIYLENISRI